MSSLRASNLTFTYAGATQPALSALSLECRAGEVTWITGALGAGCSTFLLVAAGLAPRMTSGTRTGSLEVLGSDPASPHYSAGRIAYLSASPMVQLSGVASTVYEEVAFGPANFGWPRARIDVAVRGALDRLGILPLARRDPLTLSGGELQRVVLAALAALVPQVWLLDEPVSALDAASVTRTVGLLRAEAARGTTVVIAAEDPAFGLAVADRLVVLRNGAVAVDGDPRTLLSGDDVSDAGGATPSLAALARAAAALGEASDVAPPYPLDVDDAVARWARR